MVDIRERVGVTEVQIQNLDCKLDDLKAEMRDNRDEINKKLLDMQTASTQQHGELAAKLDSLTQLKDRWTLGIVVVVSVLIATHGDVGAVLQVIKAIVGL